MVSGSERIPELSSHPGYSTTQRSDTMVNHPAPPPPAGDFMSERISLKRNYVSNHPIARPPRRMIEFYKLQVPQRRAYLDAVIESMSKNYMYLYNNLAPEAYCPELVRVGTTNDGGKWICSPFRIPVSCNILSLGMYNEITFEQELQHITDQRCNLFAYDMNKQEPRTLALLKRIKVGVRVAEVSAETNELKKQYTIEDLMKFEGISNFEILKIDIEGSEFQVIPPLLRKHKPAQILIEIHGTPSETVWLLREIASQGYWLYSYEINGAWHHL
ncbi:hypothetical protein TELCIR_08716, partial [Teladorsagia circumcincta]